MTFFLNLSQKSIHIGSISTSLLFSTAVISGSSSSAPDLKDVLNPPERFKAQSIRLGLETLHNALSLKQMDAFLSKMTNSNLSRFYYTHQIKRNIQITPYDSDVDQNYQLMNDLNMNNLNKIVLDEIQAKKTEQDARKRSTDSFSNKSSISGLMEQTIITKANTLSTSSTLTSNLSDMSASNSQLQVASSGPSSMISSSSVPSSPNFSSCTNLDYWKKTFFNHQNSIEQQSDYDHSTRSGPSSPQ